MRLAKGLLACCFCGLLFGAFGVGCSPTDKTASDQPIAVAAGMKAVTLNVKGMT
jgi:hypothetical protein